MRSLYVKIYIFSFSIMSKCRRMGRMLCNFLIDLLFTSLLLNETTVIKQRASLYYRNIINSTVIRKLNNKLFFLNFICNEKIPKSNIDFTGFYSFREFNTAGMITAQKHFKSVTLYILKFDFILNTQQYLKPCNREVITKKMVKKS